ncbi:MAG: hypothetical protein AC479_06240 [miscellaneous Crenarchaeota group-6 archaeon AD8-1]|nr:MAG: hypothetical protein AC479_06240 [miscellaneous Crenarchaeota group-6 archaeon AD8-1]
MNLRLYANKSNFGERHYIETRNKPIQIRLAVIDLDISDKYPTNFVCVLPRNFNSKTTNQNHFQSRFKEGSRELAIQLLEKALKKEKDPDIIMEIKERLKLLKSKPKEIGKCALCNKDFYPRRFGYSIQRTCNDCWNKSKP